jgi:polyhydroxyalkanoate synthesis regulator protein
MAANGGSPTTSDAWYANQKEVVARNIEEAIKQAAETAGLGGTRWSSTLGRQAQEITGNKMQELGSTYLEKEMASQEAAKQRQLENYAQLTTLGADKTGLTESATNRQLQAANDLADLGQTMYELPNTAAVQSAQVGTQLQEAQQAEIDAYLKEWERTLVENSPWIEYALTAAGLGTGNSSAQTTYDESGLSSALSTGSSLASMIAAIVSMF